MSLSFLQAFCRDTKLLKSAGNKIGCLSNAEIEAQFKYINIETEQDEATREANNDREFMRWVIEIMAVVYASLLVWTDLLNFRQ